MGIFTYFQLKKTSKIFLKIISTNEIAIKIKNDPEEQVKSLPWNSIRTVGYNINNYLPQVYHYRCSKETLTTKRRLDAIPRNGGSCQIIDFSTKITNSSPFKFLTWCCCGGRSTDPSHTGNSA